MRAKYLLDPCSILHIDYNETESPHPFQSDASSVLQSFSVYHSWIIPLSLLLPSMIGDDLSAVIRLVVDNCTPSFSNFWILHNQFFNICWRKYCHDISDILIITDCLKTSPGIWRILYGNCYCFPVMIVFFVKSSGI